MNSLSLGLCLLLSASVSEALYPWHFPALQSPKSSILGSLKCPGGTWIKTSLASSPISDSQSNYVRTTVANAAVVRRMRLVTETSPEGAGICKFRETYGFFGTDVFVNLGCQGDFYLCIIPGESAVVLCESYSWKPQTCDAAPEGAVIKSIRVDRQRSFSFCEKSITYGIRGNKIRVILGCRAYFRVGYTLPNKK